MRRLHSTGHLLVAVLRPALAASGAAQVVQFGSNSSTITPNLPDELVAEILRENIDQLKEAVREREERRGKTVGQDRA